MTDKEFKRLSRSQLIEIIYQLQLRQEELTADNEKLSKALEDRRLHASRAGNIAEEALGIHNVIQVAQNAAAHYLEEMRTRAAEDYQQIMSEASGKAAAILEKAQQEASEILEQARQEASEILEQAYKVGPDFDLAVEAVLEEYRVGQESTEEEE